MPSFNQCSESEMGGKGSWGTGREGAKGRGGKGVAEEKGIEGEEGDGEGWKREEVGIAVFPMLA